jgi:RNA polymerase sigma factor (sigma-70 family)
MQIERLFDAHQHALFRYLARYTGDPDLAEDLVQETFVRLHRRPPKDLGATRAWLFTVGTNLARDVLRQHKRRRGLLDHSPGRAPVGDGPMAPEETAVRADVAQRVQAALAQLDDRDRIMLLMREEGFTHAEIAREVGTTTKSVGTMIARALDRLARTLPLDAEDRP